MLGGSLCDSTPKPFRISSLHKQLYGPVWNPCAANPPRRKTRPLSSSLFRRHAILDGWPRHKALGLVAERIFRRRGGDLPPGASSRAASALSRGHLSARKRGGDCCLGDRLCRRGRSRE